VLTGFWRHLAYNYREGGLRQIVNKVGYRFRSAAWSESSWLVYRIDLPGYRRQPRFCLSRSDLDFDTLRNHGYVKALAFPEMIRNRIARGGRCVGFFWEGGLANLAWVTRNHLELEEGLSLEEPDSVGIFDCLTFPQYRSRGFYTESLIQLAQEARMEGLARAVIAVDPGNMPSIKGIERAGFEPVFQLSRERRLGTRRIRRTPFSARFPGSAH
jgi:hypothetical protein